MSSQTPNACLWVAKGDAATQKQHFTLKYVSKSVWHPKIWVQRNSVHEGTFHLICLFMGTWNCSTINQARADTKWMRAKDVTVGYGWQELWIPISLMLAATTNKRRKKNCSFFVSHIFLMEVDLATASNNRLTQIQSYLTLLYVWPG